MGFGGFSWNRALGITRMKQNLSRAIGIPLTRSGRERKLGAALGGNILGALVSSASQTDIASERLIKDDLKKYKALCRVAESYMKKYNYAGAIKTFSRAREDMIRAIENLKALGEPALLDLDPINKPLVCATYIFDEETIEDISDYIKENRTFFKAFPPSHEDMDPDRLTLLDDLRQEIENARETMAQYKTIWVYIRENPECKLRGLNEVIFHDGSVTYEEVAAIVKIWEKTCRLVKTRVSRTYSLRLSKMALINDPDAVVDVPVTVHTYHIPEW